MIKATPPPKVKNANWLVVPIGYAGLLAALALAQLVGFGGFDFAGINFETQGSAGAIMVLAATEIYALPFLLRLNLSPLARACSAILSMAAPLLLLANALFLRDQTVAPFMPIELVLGGALGILALASFWVLDGDKALKFKG